MLFNMVAFSSTNVDTVEPQKNKLHLVLPHGLCGLVECCQLILWWRSHWCSFSLPRTRGANLAGKKMSTAVLRIIPLKESLECDTMWIICC